METIIQKFHSGWAYVVLILLAVAVLNSLISQSKSFTPKDRKIALFALIATHLQLVIGLILYFVSPWGLHSNDKLTSMEHPTTVILAIILITIGWSRHKKLESNAGKFKSIWVFYGLGLVLILSRLPWKLWFA